MPSQSVRPCSISSGGEQGGSVVVNQGNKTKMNAKKTLYISSRILLPDCAAASATEETAHSHRAAGATNLPPMFIMVLSMRPTPKCPWALRHPLEERSPPLCPPCFLCCQPPTFRSSCLEWRRRRQRERGGGGGRQERWLARGKKRSFLTSSSPRPTVGAAPLSSSSLTLRQSAFSRRGTLYYAPCVL